MSSSADNAVSGVAEDDARRERRIAFAMEAYLEQRDQGRTVSRTDFLNQYPDVADELSARLQVLDILHGDPAESRSDRHTSEEQDLGLTPQHSALGDFRLKRPIGRGGMGIVYEAEQLSLGRTVAVKVLPFASMLDDRRRRRFRNEARAAASLDHPNIVPVYFVGQERGVHFYAMQLIEGPSLAEVIKGGGQPAIEAQPSEPETLSPQTTEFSSEIAQQRSAGSPDFYRTVARLGQQAASALEHAHHVGIVHRDIKPGNLLIDATGKLWVTDFGLACIDWDESLTRTGGIVGTAAYMSPEQAAESRNADHRSDIYSLGATLHELLAPAQTRAKADTQPASHSQAERQKMRRGRVAQGTPADLETIVLKALASDPTDRYQSAQLMAEDLQAFVDGREIQARRPAMRERASRWLLRHRISAMTAAVICVLASVALNLVMGRWSGQIAEHAEQLQIALDEKNTALLVAEQAQQQAQADRQRAELSDIRARRVSYSSDMQLAFQHTDNRDWYSAANVLQRQQKIAEEQAGTEFDVRGIEWYVLVAELAARSRLLARHDGAATECALFPDHQTAVSAGEDGLIQIRDLKTATALRAFNPNIGSIRALAVSPDGRTLAVAGPPLLDRGDRAQVTLLDALSGEVVQVIHDHDTTIESVAFSPDGQRLASGSRYSNIQISDITGQNLITITAERRNESISFSPDGTQVTAAADHWKVGIWDSTTGQPAASSPWPVADPPAHLAWSPSGQEIGLVFSDQHYAEVLQVESGTIRGMLIPPRPHARRLNCITYTRDGKLVAGDTNGQIHAWSVEEDIVPSLHKKARYEHDGKSLESFRVHRDRVTDVHVVNGGGYLSTSDDGTVCTTFPDASAAQKVPIAFPVSAAAITESGTVYTGSRDGSVRLLDAATGQHSLVATPCQDHITDLAVDGQVSKMMVAGQSGSLYLLDLITGKTFRTVQDRQAEAGMYHVAVSHDGRYGASTGVDQKLRLWDLHGGRQLGEHQLSNTGYSVEFSSDSRLLACGSDGLLVIDVASGQIKHTLPGGGHARCVQFSPDGRLLASGHWSSQIRVFDLRSEQVQVMHNKRRDVECLAFAGNGQSLVNLAHGIFGSELGFCNVDSAEDYGSAQIPFEPWQGAAPEFELAVTHKGIIACGIQAESTEAFLWPLPEALRSFD